MEDVNRIKLVLVEKGGAARLSSVSWRVPAYQQVACRAVGSQSVNSQQVVHQLFPARPCVYFENSRFAGSGSKRTIC